MHTFDLCLIPLLTHCKHFVLQQQRKNVKTYRLLRHPHVCTFHSYFETEDHCFLVMEYCPHGDLQTLLHRRRRLTEPEVAYYLGHILEALHYLHHKQMRCGHVQLSHCLIDRQGQVKLGGWGGVHGRQQLEYCAPELVCGGQETSVEADVWSLGVCLYALLVGRTPFAGPDRTTTLQRIVENQYPSDDVVVSNVAWELMGGLLRTSPMDRCVSTGRYFLVLFAYQSALCSQLLQINLGRSCCTSFFSPLLTTGTPAVDDGDSSCLG